MSDWFLLYLLTRVDDVSALLIAFSCGLMVFPPVAAFFAFLAADYREESAAIKRAIDSHKSKVVFGAVLLCFASLLPSRNDIVFIVGGSKLMEISRGDTASRLGSKTLSIVEKYLDDAASSRTEEVKQ